MESNLDATNGTAATGLDPNAAVGFYFQDPEWKFKTALGSLLVCTALLLIFSGRFFLPMLPVAFLIWAVVQGYILRVMRAVIKGSESTLPVWNDWLELIVSGLTWLAIVTGQLMVMASVVTISLLIGGKYGLVNPFAPHFKAWFLVSLMALSATAFMTSFFFPLLMVNFAEQERVLSALSMSEAMKRLMRRPREYFTVWLLSLGIFWLAVILPALTVFGIVLIPLGLFLTNTINAIMLAQVWRASAAPAAITTAQ
jgi:Protein of unknown function (DUF4013)